MAQAARHNSIAARRDQRAVCVVMYAAVRLRRACRPRRPRWGCWRAQRCCRRRRCRVSGGCKVAAAAATRRRASEAHALLLRNEESRHHQVAHKVRSSCLLFTRRRGAAGGHRRRRRRFELRRVHAKDVVPAWPERAGVRDGFRFTRTGRRRR